jgi:hypothetical protein
MSKAKTTKKRYCKEDIIDEKAKNAKKLNELDLKMELKKKLYYELKEFLLEEGFTNIKGTFLEKINII